MRPIDFMQQHLLIMDSHNSYMIVNFIAFCIKHLIDLFILFFHTSHLLQLLDVGMFSLLKCVLVDEINIIVKLNSNCILRAN